VWPPAGIQERKGLVPVKKRDSCEEEGRFFVVMTARRTPPKGGEGETITAGRNTSLKKGYLPVYKEPQGALGELLVRGE